MAMHVFSTRVRVMMQKIDLNNNDNFDKLVKTVIDDYRFLQYSRSCELDLFLPKDSFHMIENILKRTGIPRILKAATNTLVVLMMMVLVYLSIIVFANTDYIVKIQLSLHILLAYLNILMSISLIDLLMTKRCKTTMRSVLLTVIAMLGFLHYKWDLGILLFAIHVLYISFYLFFVLRKQVTQLDVFED